MFKYRYTPLVLLMFIVLTFLLFVKKWNKDKLESDTLLTNNIEFEGEIIDLKVSDNHLFGIIKLKVDNTNTKIFLSSDINIYPYRIKDSIAEVYNYISYDLRKGIRVKVNSNKRCVSFYNNNTFMYDLDMWIITEKENVDFIKNNTFIK